MTGPNGVNNAGLSYESNNGAVTSPAAGGVLATTGVIPAGTYSVSVTANLAGTVAQGTDNNNIRLNVNNATLAILPNDITTGIQSFGPFIVTSDGIHAILAQANAAATAGAIYAAQVVATPLSDTEGTPFTLQLGGRIWNLLLPTSGILCLAGPLGIRLNQDDIRQLTSSVAGDWNFELMGHADVPYRRP